MPDSISMMLPLASTPPQSTSQAVGSVEQTLDPGRIKSGDWLMATLHFICGKAGAGKTTLARKLGCELPAVVICEDEWLAELSDPIECLEQYVTASRRLRRALTPHIVELLRLGNDVVLDAGANNVPHGRAWVRRMFEAAGAEHVLHYLGTDDATCLARVRLRNVHQPPGLFFGLVSDALVTEVNRHVVAPTSEEGFVILVHERTFLQPRTGSHAASAQ